MFLLLPVFFFFLCFFLVHTDPPKVDDAGISNAEQWWHGASPTFPREYWATESIRIQETVITETPLHLAASEALCMMAKLLLEAGISKDRWGETPLDEGRMRGNKKLIMLLKDARSAQLSDFPESSPKIKAASMLQFPID
ncbi:hypothetical protein MLD38_033770 [Melastoma candidum]|uniref:Uncharacterized protein n=1 Tax=Melastoma candidum TaxID=119954 RepID=A0ACB9M8B1_9MYRT|nr:hypothetical protein MLD38_033770 [Melastoma candidum]